MIVFDLACACGYSFEGWFQDHKDFVTQQTASFLICPECGSREIRKILSPVCLRSANCEAASAAEKPGDNSDSLTDAEKTLDTLQKFVLENFEDVGSDLANESLKIHYGVAEPRNIRGVTTGQEEKKLREEGIDLIKIPLPEKNNSIN